MKVVNSKLTSSLTLGDEVKSIFNEAKKAEEYGSKKLFLTGEVGLVDTVNKHYPKLYDLYKEMKQLDWDELEFDYSQCIVDFEKAPKDVSDMMLETIMFQWESDSVASQAPVYLIAPYQPCTELWQAELRITDNESVHANTYSEIVRMGFKTPEKVLEDMLSKVESMKRLSTVGKCLRSVMQHSINTAYEREMNNVEPSEKEVREQLIIYYFSMLCLERLQFMASFAVTFTICQSGWFQPIGQAVKKICQDELEVHSEFRKEVLKELTSDELGKEVLAKLQPILVQILEEVTDNELEQTVVNLFKNGERSLVGTNEKFVSQWVLFNAKDVASVFKLKTKHSYPKSNPMPHLEKWINMNKNQAANQEQDNPAYKLNVIERNDQDKVYVI